MNAPAPVTRPIDLRNAPSARAEHISLETSPDMAAAPSPPHRGVLATFKLSSAMRGCSTEVSILEDHYLAVRTERLGMPVRKYAVDLRFANPQPVRVRRVAWYCIAATFLAITAAGGLMGLALTATTGVSIPLLVSGALCAVAAGLAAFFSLRRTTESLEFISVHGGAALVRITGGIGSTKAGKRFFIELIKNVSAAKQARAQSEQHFLRDEMREHHRLRELNVLTEAEYEASKARILKAHA